MNSVLNGIPFGGTSGNESLAASHYQHFTTGGTDKQSYPSSNNSLWDLANLRKEIQKEKIKHEEIIKVEKFLESLHPETIKIVELTYKLHTTNNIEDIKTLDKYIQSVLFKEKLENLVLNEGENK